MRAIALNKLLRPHPLYFLRRILQKDVFGYLVVIFCVLFAAYIFWQLFIRDIPKDQVIDYKIANEVIYGK